MHTKVTKPLLFLFSILITALATPTPSKLELRQYNGSVPDLSATATIIANPNSTDCDGAYPFGDSSTSQGTTFVVADNVCIPLNTNPNNTALSVSIVDVNPFNTTNPENTTFVGFCSFVIWEDSICTGDATWGFGPIYGEDGSDWTCMADIGWDDGSTVFGSIMLVCDQSVVLPPPVPSVPHYGMCGGISWTGPTVCLPPWVCTEDNEYFWQCL